MTAPSLVLLGLTLLLQGGKTMPTERVTNEAARAIISQLESGQTPTTAETMRWRTAPNVVRDLTAAIEEHYPQLRAAALPVLADLGRPVVPAQGDVPERLAPFVDNPAVVAYLVRTLNNVSAARTEACRILVEDVPGPRIREHADAIVTAVRRFPAVSGGVLLLGKTGFAAANALIVNNPALRAAAPPKDIEIALARLGDQRSEEAVLRAYAAAEAPADKAAQALRVGYIGTRRAAQVLARDIRTPETYAWLRQARRSMRIHVIQGLNLAFPTEPLFWKPFFKPEDDRYYDALEKWLTGNLQITWDVPRPPFLYQEDAAAPPGGPH